MPMKRTQLLIIGGGCAGLSLARRLARASKSIQAVVVEPRTQYSDDRTWCFWAGQPSGLGPVPLISWQKINVCNGQTSVNCSFGQNPYQMLRSIDFYRASIDEIEASSDIELCLGTSVLASRKLPSGKWETDSTQGTIISDFVVDTRASIDRFDVAPLLWQNFVGFEIVCKSPIFATDVVQLMNFQTASSEGIDFVYLLPTSSNQALIEFTTLSSNGSAIPDLTKKLHDVVEKICGDRSYQILRREQGAIPMGLSSPPISEKSTYVRVGVTAGSARPSSGYTFCRIQKWADACSQSILRGDLPIGPLSDTPLVRFMDHIFLKVLKHYPLLGPELFLAIFQKVPVPRLLRFLSDSPNLLDAIFLMAALPKGPFLKECFRPICANAKPSNEVPCFR